MNLYNYIIGVISPIVNTKMGQAHLFFSEKTGMEFYDRVKELVKKQNLSLIPFLSSIGINYESYKSAKRQGNILRADDAFRIASALGTTVEYLVTGNSPVSHDYQRLRERILRALEEE